MSASGSPLAEPQRTALLSDLKKRRGGVESVGQDSNGQDSNGQDSTVHTNEALQTHKLRSDVKLGEGPMAAPRLPSMIGK